MEKLDSAFTISDDSGATALISGGSGMGKSRLIREFSNKYARTGTRILWGGSTRNYYTPPLAPWISIIDSLSLLQDEGVSKDARTLSDELSAGQATLLGSRGMSGSAEKFVLFRRLADIICAQHDAKTIIVIDDLHLADELSLNFLEFLNTAIRGRRVLLIGVYNQTAIKRHSSLSQTLGAIGRSQNLVRVSLKPLSEAEVTEIIEAKSEVDIPPDTKQVIIDRAEGNPFFVHEIVQHMNSLRDLDYGGDRSDQLGAIPEGVSEIVGQRLDQLPEICNELLRFAAVIGREFNSHALETINWDSSGTPGMVHQVLADAVSAGFVERIDRTGNYRFDHALVHETIIDEIPPQNLDAISAKIAKSVELTYGPNANLHAGELATRYFQAASVVGTAKAIYYSMLAGEQAHRNFSYKEAASHFNSVLSATSEDEDQEVRFAAMAGYGAAMVALAPRSEKHMYVRVLTEALDYFVATEQIDQAVNVALTEVVPIAPETNVGTDIAGMIGRVIDLVPQQTKEHGALLSRLALALITEKQDYESAREAALVAGNIATGNGDATGKLISERVIVALGFRGHSDRSEFVDSVRKLIRDAVHLGDVETELRGLWYLVSTLMSYGRSIEAKKVLETLSVRAEEYQETGTLQQTFSMQANLAVRFGEWKKALELSTESLRRFGPSEMLEGISRSIEIYAGDVNSILGLIDYVEHGPESFTGSYSRLAIAISLYCNHVDLTGRRIDSVVRLLIDDPKLEPKIQQDRTTLTMAKALLACSLEDQETMSECYLLLSEPEIPVLQNVGILPQRVLMKLADKTSQLESAKNHIDLAIDAYEQESCLPELAFALIDRSELLLRSGARHQLIIDNLNRSEEIASSLSMSTLLDRINRVRAQLTVATQQTKSQIDGLTAREIEVLLLISDGLTNKRIGSELFVSENTVRRHISNIFIKIGVENRTEATAYVFENNITAREED
jgi:DNA-binding CsgD family transcriptional regulator